jgi:hypothetical protein
MPALTGDTPIVASGTVTLTMIVNLKRFIHRSALVNGEGIDSFEQYRGTQEFADYLEALPTRMRAPFYRDVEEDARLDAAHNMRIFRGYVVHRYFFPTYRLDEDAFMDHIGDMETDRVLIDTFPLWDYQISLTRNGFAVVRMIRHFEDVPLSTIATEIQKVERARDADLEYAESRSSWRIAMDVTASLLRAMGHSMTFPGKDGTPVTLEFDPEQRKGRLPLHDRYTTIHLANVHRGGERITPDDFIDQYGSFALGMMRLATVLRGGAAHDMRRRRQVLPGDLFNLSPWHSDVCLVTNDAMLVYSAREDTGVIQQEYDGYSRAAFWQGVARGVEWLVNLKTEWQLIERRTTEMLSTISTLTASVNDGLLDEADKQRLQNLAQGVSQAFNILPELRYALVPASVTHATDVVQVYRHVLSQLGVYRVAEHVNANMDELSDFLTYYSSTQLQFESREQEETENRTGLTISIMLILLSLVSVPSLIKDASEIDWALVIAEPTWQLATVIILALLPIILLSITTMFALRNLRRRK